jgi:branched-chain amino acid transport system substrate-binding protein
MTTPTAPTITNATSRTRGTRRLLTAVICLAAILVAAWAAPAATLATSTAPGITRTSVLIGSDQPLTGPPAVGYSEIAPASAALFEYINARGGVNGRKLRYRYLDDADVSSRALADEKKLVLTDHVFAVFNAFGFATHQAVVGFLNARHVPDLFVGSSCACWNEPEQHPDTFGFGTNYNIEGRLIGHYVARVFPTSKIGLIWEDDGCCGGGVRQLETEIPQSQIATSQPFTIAELSSSLLRPQVKAAQSAGVRVLVLDTLAPAAVAEVLLDAESLGYHPTIVDTFRLSADPSTVATWLARLSGGKASPALENGLVTQDYLPSAGDTSNPWIRLFLKIHNIYEPRAPFDNMTTYGMAAAYTFVRALARAGRNPTRESIESAIEHGAVNLSGPALIPLKDSGTDHDGFPGEQIGKIENGTLVLSGPAYETSEAGPVISHRISRSAPPRQPGAS